MYQTEAEAIEAAELGEEVEYCHICEAWTIIDVEGFCLCLCV